MAQAFRRLGSKVTVLEARAALAKDNPELTATSPGSRCAPKASTSARTPTCCASRSVDGAGVRVTLEGPDDTEVQVDGSHLLLATGRRPDLDELALAKARIRFDEKGIKVNARLRTRNHRVYAIGDVAGGAQFTHWAGYQAGLVVRSILFRFGGKMRPEILPWVTFTEPELAHVGLSEDGGAPPPPASSGAALALRRERPRQHRRRPPRHDAGARHEERAVIVGADTRPRGASELIAPFVLAVAQRLEHQGLRHRRLPLPNARGGGAPRRRRLLRGKTRFAADPPRYPFPAEVWMRRARLLARRSSRALEYHARGRRYPMSEKTPALPSARIDEKRANGTARPGSASASPTGSSCSP